MSVSNPGDSPLPVRDVDGPGKQPFTAAIIINVDDGELSGVGLAAVPAGKRFVVEFAAADCLLAVGQKGLLSLSAITAGSRHPSPLVLTPQAQLYDGSDSLVASQLVRLYADPGEPIAAEFFRSPRAGVANCRVNLSGHLVDVP